MKRELSIKDLCQSNNIFTGTVTRVIKGPTNEIVTIRLDPGESIGFHIHYHPYLVVSLGGGENEIETIFGDRIKTVEELGSTVFINDMRAVHRLTNRAKIPYLSRLIELKHIRWTTEAKD